MDLTFENWFKCVSRLGLPGILDMCSMWLSSVLMDEVLQAAWTEPSGPSARKLVLEEIARLPLHGNVPQVPRETSQRGERSSASRELAFLLPLLQMPSRRDSPKHCDFLFN